MGRCPKRNRDLINFERLVDFEKCHDRSFLEAIVCLFFNETFLILYISMEKIIVIMHEK